MLKVFSMGALRLKMKKKKKTVKKNGRPFIKIDAAMCDKAESLAAQGLNMEQIASVLGMCKSTLHEKKARFSDFSDTIKKGRAKGIGNMTNALFTKGMAGDTTAMIFYLKNRDPENWEDVQKRHYYGKNKESLFPTEYKVTVVHTNKIKKED